jgi:predicted nucleotidyltransferase
VADSDHDSRIQFDYVVTADYTGLRKVAPTLSDMGEDIMKYTDVDIPLDEIAAFCRRHHIRELALFGSILRKDFTPDSDVDVLIDFEPEAEKELTLLDLVGMQLELSQILEREVDLVLRDGLKPLIKDEVLATREVIYAL